MKRLFFSGLILLFLLGIAGASSTPDVSVNIVHKGEMLKEISGEVWMPFYEEYSIRLQNYATVRAVAKITIDGIEVSKFGEIVIPSTGKIDLERFLDHSLTEGKRFKFVPITHPEVQDKGSPENGKIRVEIRKEKMAKIIEVVPPNIPKPITGSPWPWIDAGTANSFQYGPPAFTTSTNCSSSSMGATIGGSASDQRFTQINLDLEDSIITLEFRLRGY